MAQLTSIKMSKFDNQPWGFRLQGGIDFAAPLTVQKVNGGSLAEKAGLRVGDALIRVNNTDIFQLRHKEAQDTVSKAGNNFELVVSRGGGMPKTAVKPSDALDNIQRPAVAAPAPAPIQQQQPEPLVYKKSLNLTAKPFVRSTQTTPTSVSLEGLKNKTALVTESSEFTNNNYLTSPPLSDRDISFGSSTKSITPDETSRAKELLTQRLAVMRIQPSSPPVRTSTQALVTPVSSPSSSLTLNKSNKSDGGNVKLVNRQFNSPMGLYSEENIAETLSSQAEVLAQGVLGVNFKKNEKTYDPGNSEVFKMVQEIDRAPREPEPDRHQHMAHSATPTHKPISSPATFPVNNFGSFHSPSAHPPPAGGVRIFPAGPAPPVKQQVKPAPAPAPVYAPAPPAIKPVSFAPTARPAGVVVRSFNAAPKPFTLSR